MITLNKLLLLAIPSLVIAVAPIAVSCRTTESPSTQMSDSAITTKIKAKMIADSEVAAHNVGVKTEEGVVYLTGRVQTRAERDRAEEIARSTEGVRSVVDHVEVGDATHEASADRNSDQ